MSAITGSCDLAAIAGRASASSWLGQATRMMSHPAAVSSAICCSFALTSAVSVVVIDCTEIGASPPTRTLPTLIWRLRRRGLSTGGGGAGNPRGKGGIAGLSVLGGTGGRALDAGRGHDVADDEDQPHDEQRSSRHVGHREQLRNVDVTGVGAVPEPRHSSAYRLEEGAGDVTAIQGQQRDEVEHADEEVEPGEQAHQEH